MPKPKKKTQEEISSQDYFHIEKEDLKRTIEKKEKAPPSEKSLIAKKTIEKQQKTPLQIEEIPKEKPKFKRTMKGKAKFSKTKYSKTKFKSAKTQISYSPPIISLKEKGYELIITEKPQAALKISSALGSVEKRNQKGIPFYEVNRKGEKIVVACAVGHLFTLVQNKKGSDFPIFDISWVPNYIAKKADFTKKYYDAILTLVKNAGSLTVATDYDIEGEVIGYNVVRYICGQKDANRMKFSTLTDLELNQAYENKSPTINWGQAIAGETRHYLDWFYGINLSRALMSSIKKTGKFRIMSIGRVQGPALNLIVEKEKEIQSFKSEKYWQVFITAKNKHTLELKYIKDIFDKKELTKFKDIKGKTGIAETKKTSESLPPNPPFNLTTLQIESYKFYGLNPSRTLQIAQSLYLAGLISYPRTSSQKLPAAIGYKDILKELAKKYKVENLIKRETPIEGNKTDPAHPSIYPTGNFQILSGEDEKIYNLIVKRFLSLFCEDAIIDKKRISVEVDNLLFATNGSAIKKKAWLDIYPSKLKEVEVPDMEGEVKIIDSRTEEKETQPPRRFSPASIISELEKRNLGTKATRASIMETLVERGYIRGQSIEATPLGISLIDTLKKHSPIIIDEKLTRSFEDSMDSITESTKDFEEKEEKIIEKAKKTITEISKDFEKKGLEIGTELVKAEIERRDQEKKENVITECPKCKKGQLAIMYSRKTRRSFVACNAYPECENTYSLPPNRLIKKTDKICEKCNFPMLLALAKGKKPWFFCFNKECETNKQRIEEYNQKKEEEKE